MTPSALRKSKNKTRLLKTDKKRTYLYLKKTRFPPPRSHRMDNRYIDECPHWLYVGTRCKKFIQMIWRTKQEWKSYKNINADVVDACINLLFITCDLWPFLTCVQLHFWHFDSSYCKNKTPRGMDQVERQEMNSAPYDSRTQRLFSIQELLLEYSLVIIVLACFILVTLATRLFGRTRCCLWRWILYT